MNVLTPSPLPATPAAPSNAIPAMPVPLPPGAAAPAVAPRFDRTLQQIVLGATPSLADTVLAAVADAAPTAYAGQDVAAGDATDDKTDASDTAAAAPLPDLLLSGLLQHAPTWPATPAPAAPTASPAPTAAAPKDAAAMAIAMLTAPAGLPVAPLAAQAAAALPAPAPNAMPPVAAPVAAMPTMPTMPVDMALQADDQQPAPAAPIRSAALPAETALAPIWRELRQATTPDATAGTPADAAIVGAGLAGPDGASREATATGTPAASGRAAAHPLQRVLGDNIALQLQRGSEHVVIRLDPPLHGRIEISIRHDAAGAMQVQLSGSSGELVRQLQGISDGLRQELVQRQAGDVNVQVAHGGRDQDGRQRQERQPSPQNPGRALADDQDNATDFALATDRDGR